MLLYSTTLYLVGFAKHPTKSQFAKSVCNSITLRACQCPKTHTKPTLLFLLFAMPLPKTTFPTSTQGKNARSPYQNQCFSDTN
jgi:hypothetical protein